ncbi:MAG: hypothetical protein JOY62_04935 [Acidobacteriaceae bacterium]|nr:hypothetical protein [Acidobacteriaceae bacterium]MBV9779300.1 hypothetical protein [Acidobacteriaceae bacterium]
MPIGICLSLLTVLVVMARSQTGKESKHKTPEQVKYQSEMEHWRAARNELRTRARAALDAERAREKAGDCPNADTTFAAEKCLNAEIDKTQGNYAAFTSALREMLGLARPLGPGEMPISGPTGMPLSAPERVAEFDRIENEWKRYRDLCTAAAYDEFKGGTEAPVFELEAQQRLARLHLEELSFIYDNELANH